MRKSILIFIFACVFMTACSDLEPVGLPAAPKVSPTTSHSGARKTVSYEFGTNVKITTYDVDPIILGYFQHYWQNSTTSLLTTAQKNNSCGATSYMMAANCMAAYKNQSYGATAAKQKAIYDKTRVTLDGQLKLYASLYTLWLNYGQKDDVNIVRSRLPAATTSRATLAQSIEQYLSENSAVIVAVNACVSDGIKPASELVHTDPYYSASSLINPDLDLPSNTGQKYITGEAVDSSVGSYKVGGHIIIVIGVIKRSDGTEFAVYVDPISKTRTSNRKYVSYKRLLDSIMKNSSNSARILGVGPKV